MRHNPFFAALIAAALALSASAANAAGWTKFTDPAGAFTLEVPETPKVDTGSSNNQGHAVPHTNYMIDRGDSAMLMMVSDFSGLKVDPVTGLDGSVANMQTSGRVLVSDVKVMLDGHPGRDVTLTDQQGHILFDRLFFFNNHLYQAITVLPQNPTPAQRAMVTRYAKSLHFLR